jgi:phosphoribosylaminoimidazole-succinocarboxamide synthase
MTLEGKIEGKVRNQYRFPSLDMVALVTTDRQSGFDRALASVPYKGQVLNQISAFWFSQTSDIIPNQVISIPHPNVCIAKAATPFAVEMVVRSYMTGSTSTSIWKNYASGCRSYCGISLPEGMSKNEKLWENLFTPTTKDEHDRPISCEEIVELGLMSQEDLDYCKAKCLEIFARGQAVAKKNGLILVDTKFELGKDKDGTIMLIDEVLTPDSSRYWIEETYAERVAEGKEPENIDKEFLRLWFADNCDPYDLTKTLPEAPKDLVVELSRRYIGLYEMITGKDFDFDDRGEEVIESAIKEAAK